MYYTKDGINLYRGDLLAGDRKATNDEILIYEEKLKLETEIQIARQYLKDTDFKMTIDYDQDTSEVRIKRSEYRSFIRANESKV